jgi:5-methylthioadenosine/S-adenosylhomocysteine deaminase
MQEIDLMIHARWLITCEANNRVLEQHALLIQGDKIVAILPSTEARLHYQAKKEEHYSNHAVLPGFINSHTHIAMNIFRGLADDLELMDWLNHHIWPAESKWVSHDLVYDASLLAMAEMIRSGTTCFNDMYFFLEATAKAAEKSGMRAFIGMTVIDVPTAYAKTPDEYFAKGREFYQQYKNHDLITPTFAPHSTYTVSLDNLIKVRQLAENYQVKINIHLHESESEIQQSMSMYNKRPLQRLYEIGMVSPQLIAIHMAHINDQDQDILQKTKPQIVSCPESNMKLASGACPLQRLHLLGLNLALGTDGAASNNDLNMIGEMRSAAFFGKITAHDPKAVSAETALTMATINGAKALGIDHLTGSLEPGKSADFIAIDLEQIETQPLYQPMSQIVYAASRQQVTDVFVAGKQLLKNRQLLTLDQDEIIKKAQNWRNKIST